MFTEWPVVHTAQSQCGPSCHLKCCSLTVNGPYAKLPGACVESVKDVLQMALCVSTVNFPAKIQTFIAAL